jgi:hypothetical protein
MRIDSWRSGRPAKSFGKTTLVGLMAVLKDEKQRLYQTQERERQDKGQRQPQSGVNPIWRVEREFNKEGTAGNDCTYDQNCENGRPVTGIEHRVVETA